MILFLSITFTVLNIVLWFIFFVRFTKLFTTDDIVQRTRTEMDRLVRDINNHAARDIDLIEDRIKRLKSLIDEADKKIQLMEQELEKQSSISLMKQQVKSPPKNNPRNKPMEQRAIDTYKAAGALSFQHTYELTREGEAYQDSVEQGNLFSQKDEPVKYIDTQTQVVVSQDGSATAEIPVVVPKIYFAEEPIPEPEKTFDEKVMALYNRGYGVEDIAKELSASMIEVQFVLEINK